MSLEIDIKRCKGCSLCIDACPKEVLKISSRTNGLGIFYAEISSLENCSGCGICYTVCPDVCIEVSRNKE